MTTEEIKSLQRELGVTPDGIIGPKTRAAAQAKIEAAKSIAEAESLSVKYGSITNTTGLVYGVDSPQTQDTSTQKDEYGFTEDDYEAGIPIYRKDAPAGGERVFSNKDLKKAINDGYSLTTVDITEGPSAGTSAEEAGADKVTNGDTSAPSGSIEATELMNVPKDSYVWEVDGKLYIAYEVPGSNGETYDGPAIFMAYEVTENDLYKAGLLTEGMTFKTNTITKEVFDSVAIVSGNTDQLSSEIESPFASFVETVTEQAAVAPWITDIEVIALLAEASIEGREVTDAEWQSTTWYKEHNEAERSWLRTFYADPSTATQLTTDAQIAVKNSLEAAGIYNPPTAITNWIANKYVSGQWSQAYTSEQVSLFADPYASGTRDSEFENYLSSTSITGVDRTTEKEREVKELYAKWLGPTLGKLSDKEVSEIAGRLREDSEYEDALIQELKQSRLAAFSNYTNPELTYEDIARPWRNLTTSVWGQTADETQGWWQEMVKSNDFAKAQTTLREKGLEQDVTQVTQDATQALQQALGQGQVSQSGVNV